MKKTLLLVAILLVTGAAARADEVCSSATLADYIAQGSCTLPYSVRIFGSPLPVNYNATLSGFSYTPGSGAPPASQITVTPSVTVFEGGCPVPNTVFCVEVDAGFGGFSTTASLSGGLDFSVGSGVSSFEVANLSLAGNVPSGASIAADAALSNGFALSTQVVNPGVNQPFSRAYLGSSGLEELSVQDSFAASAGLSGSPTSFSFTNSFITPEPATLLLMGWGLAGLLATGRKLRAPRPF